MKNLHFGCSMLEVICGNRQMKKLENCWFNILKHNSLHSNYLLNTYKIKIFPLIIDESCFMGNLYFGCSILEVICGNWQMKKLENVDTIF